MTKVVIFGIIIAIIAISVIFAVSPIYQENQISLKPTVFDDDGDGFVNSIDTFAQNPKEWDDFASHTNVFGATYSEKFFVFPISSREMQNNPQLIQNPNY